MFSCDSVWILNMANTMFNLCMCVFVFFVYLLCISWFHRCNDAARILLDITNLASDKTNVWWWKKKKRNNYQPKPNIYKFDLVTIHSAAPNELNVHCWHWTLSLFLCTYVVAVGSHAVAFHINMIATRSLSLARQRLNKNKKISHSLCLWIYLNEKTCLWFRIFF